jgi:hypothetical protein
VPPVGSSLGDGSDVALFGGEVVLADRVHPRR